MARGTGATRVGTRFRVLYVSVASVLVLLAAGTFALGPTRVGLSLTMRETYVGGLRQVLYGSVHDPDGDPVPGVIVRLAHRADGRWVRDLRATTGEDGVYRRVLNEEPGRYQIVIRLPGTDVTTSRMIRLRAGWAVETSAEVTEDGQLILLPIFHY